MREMKWHLWCVAAATLLLGSWLAPPTSAQTQNNQLKLTHAAGDDALAIITWNGWTEPDSKSANRTERLLAEQSLKDFFNDLTKEVDKVIAEQTNKLADEKANIIAGTVPLMIKTALTHPTALVMGEKGNGSNPVSLALVVDAGKDIDSLVAAVHRMLKATTPQEGPFRAIEENLNGAKFLRPERAEKPGLIRVGSHGSHFIVTIGEEVTSELIKRLDQKKNATFVESALKDLPVDRPQVLVNVRVDRLLALLKAEVNDPNLPRGLKAFGVDNVKNFTVVGGFDATGMQFNSALTFDGPMSGIFTLIPNKPLTLDALKRVPANASQASVMRFDLAHAIDTVLGIVGQMDPKAKMDGENAMNGLSTQVGFSIKDDLAKGLGDEWTIYTSGSEAGAFFMPGLVISASVRDQAGVQKALDVLLQVLKATAQRQGPQAPFSVQEYTVKGNKAVRVQFNGLPIPISPAWALTKDEFVLSLTPQLVSSHLSQAGKPSLADSAVIKDGFKQSPQPIMVSYSDPKPGLQTVYTLVSTFGPFVTGQLAQQGVNFALPPLPPMSDLEQHLAPSVTMFSMTKDSFRSESHGVIPSGVEMSPAAVGIGVALLLPAVQQAREAARRAQDKNNLKQIGLAMHNSHDTYNRFPPQAIRSKKDNKKLLSWRVHILPFIEEAPLYQQFKLDEPWDSPNNKPLIEKMPRVYASPNHDDLTKQGKTVFVAPTGKGTFWDDPEGRRIRDVIDGTSNTVMVVEAHKDSAVIWTKPDDIEIDFENPIKHMKSARVGGFHVLISDGSVRFISDNINVTTLKALFTHAGGETLRDF